jgi:hypothetical protein
MGDFMRSATIALMLLFSTLAFAQAAQSESSPRAQAGAQSEMGNMQMDSTSSEMSGMPGMNAPAQKPRKKPKQSMPAMPGMNAPAKKPSKKPEQPMPVMPGMNMPATKPGKEPEQAMSAMPGMNEPVMPNMAGMSSTGILGSYPMSRDASGTSWQPDDAEHHGLHAMAGDWMLMGHLMLWGIYDTQSGPRGGDMFLVPGMLMGSARRDFTDRDTLNFRAMLSPEPFMGRRGYPLLLASGETANGVTPLIDRQHPHDLFMELSAIYRRKLSGEDNIFLYAGYPGEPALGPPAFMHRASGMDIPEAPITHHWLDSTHITFGVLTAGFVHGDWKLEVSQFTGREPDQRRFNFDPIRLDSTAVRASWNPDEHWALQASWGHLHSPEQLQPSVDEKRYTASAMYVTRIGNDGSLAATLAWGLKSLSDGTNLNGVLLEGEYKPCDLWTIFARAEWEENNELASSGAIRGVSELSIGGIHDWQVAQHWKLGLGALYAFDFVQSSLKPAYGSGPHGAMGFVRVIVD